jgi:hypothetical protein
MARRRQPDPLPRQDNAAWQLHAYRTSDLERARSERLRDERALALADALDRELAAAQDARPW